MTCRTTLLAALVCSLSLSSPCRVAAAPRADGELRIEVVDVATGKPIAARMHLNSGRAAASTNRRATARTRGPRTVELKLPDTAPFGDHFYIDGELTLPLRAGQYVFELDAGPEYYPQTGHFEIQRRADDSKKIEMKRVADLAKEGWYAGDLDFDRKPDDLPLVLRAEGLQDVKMAKHGALLVDQTKDAKTGDSQTGLRIARVPYAWNLPVWLAKGDVDAIQIIHHHALRDDVDDNEDDGRPRDKSFFTGPRGNGLWSEAIYYHVLNCGLRIPPAAGSGSGTNKSPLGTNRVYVHCDEFSPAAWWEGLEAGRVFVTNGPLLRPTVEGEPPGYVFHLNNGESFTFEIGLNLATRVPVEYLQIVKNGSVEGEVRLAEWKGKTGHLPPISFDDSGWFLVRAVTANVKTYQFASSGPYYVERSDRPRVSRKSVQFFLDWIEDAKNHVSKMPNLDDAARASLLAEQESARQFFEGLLAQANAD